MKIETVGAIIAGGQSSRMNTGGIRGDKFLQRLNHMTIIEHVFERLSPQVDHMVLNANGDPARFGNLNAAVISDVKSSHGGPLVGILTALKFVQNANWLLTAAGDSPFVPLDFAAQLRVRQQQTGARVVLASSGEHMHPVFGLWNTDLTDDLEAWLATTQKASVLSFANSVGFSAVDFPMAAIPNKTETHDPFFNINYPENLDEARRLNEALQ